MTRNHKVQTGDVLKIFTPNGYYIATVVSVQELNDRRVCANCDSDRFVSVANEISPPALKTHVVFLDRGYSFKIWRKKGKLRLNRV